MSLNLTDLVNENERLEDGNQQDFLDNFVKMPEKAGHVTVRILSKANLHPGKGGLFMLTRIHRVNNKSLHCPREYQGGRWIGECPICKYYSYIWKESEKKGPEEAKRLQDMARAIKPIERYYYNVIVRKVRNEKTDQIELNVGPKILSVGKTLHKMIIRAMVGNAEMEEKPLGDITDLKNGRDFKIVKNFLQSGANVYPTYADSKFLDPSPAGDPEEVARWIENLHDLCSLRNVKPEEELKKQLQIHLGVIKDDNSSGFDPSEFEKKPEPAIVINDRTETSTANKVASSNKAVQTEEVASESITDEEFLSELKSMQ